jgi:ABC-type transport system involved in multi-copper enzyme maturation permease subunit
VTAVWTIVLYGLQEALRRKIFTVVLLLTAGFLALFWLGNHYAFRDLSNVGQPQGIDARTFVGAFIFGLAMFATFFLGVVLAIFLTINAVRGDAERGLLQPLVVRPVGRAQLLLARYLGTVGVCTPYVLAVYFTAMVIVGNAGHWWPDRVVTPGIELAGAVAIVAALSLLGSIFLTATANGIAIFMLFGAGLVAGLIGTIGHAIHSQSLSHAARVGAYVLPFEALYQDALRQITIDTTGATAFLLQLGPFGGAYTTGPFVRLWAVAYLALAGVLGVAAFRRRDL